MWPVEYTNIESWLVRNITLDNKRKYINTLIQRGPTEVDLGPMFSEKDNSQKYACLDDSNWEFVIKVFIELELHFII